MFNKKDFNKLLEQEVRIDEMNEHNPLNKLTDEQRSQVERVCGKDAQPEDIPAIWKN